MCPQLKYPVPVSESYWAGHMDRHASLIKTISITNPSLSSPLNPTFLTQSTNLLTYYPFHAHDNHIPSLKCLFHPSQLDGIATASTLSTRLTPDLSCPTPTESLSKLGSKPTQNSPWHSPRHRSRAHRFSECIACCIKIIHSRRGRQGHRRRNGSHEL